MKLTDDKLRMATEKYSTPLYIFDEDEFLTRFDYFRKYLGEEIGLTFCMKTNPFLTKVSLAEAERIEVCSDGEFRLCRDLAIPPERLLISGVLKREEDLREIIHYSADKAIYTAESESQLKLLNQIASEQGYKLPLLLRLTSGNQFGMDEETILQLIRQKEKFTHLEFAGIHFFSGTQKHRIAKHRKELEKLDAFFERIEEETGFHVPMLEYGTGFGAPYFDGQEEDVTSTESLIEFRKMLTNMKWKGKITLEMGRALAYQCGSYITKVCDVKKNGGKNYVIVDGGIHQLHYDGQIRGMYLPEIQHLRNSARDAKNDFRDNIYDSMKNNPEDDLKESQHYTICGSLCTVNDIITADYVSSEIRRGDYLVFCRAGAYSVYEGMSLFLSHELPGVVLYSTAKGFREARKQQQTYRLNMPNASE
jgi:diaminopimelate decarboxylase